MRIADLRATTVTVPLEAPLRLQEMRFKVANLTASLYNPDRPTWSPLVPNDRWADPHEARPPMLRG